MAMADYQHCEKCGCKTFYDAHIDWATQNVAQSDYDDAPADDAVMSLCPTCYETHQLVLQPRVRP